MVSQQCGLCRVYRQKLRTESSDSVAILLGAAGWSIGSALLLVAPDAWVVLATLAAGVGEAARR